MENNPKLRETIPNIMNLLRAYQYSDAHMDVLRRHFYQVIDYYNATGITYYKPGIYDSFLLQIEKEYTSGNLRQNLFWLYRKCAFFIDEYCRLGTVTPKILLPRTRYKLNDEFGKSLENYLYSLKTTIKGSTINQRRLAIRKYLFYLQSNGCKTLDDITVDDVRQYFLKLSSVVSNRTLNQNRLHIRQFHVYLYETNNFAPCWLAFLDFKVVVPRKIQGYLTPEEIENILAQINVDTNMGKRDYAIICLAKTTGLRGIDIINLKLTDIDWSIGIITVCQKKTGITLKLPLLREAGDALKDYIINGRHVTDCKEIFIRINAPYTAFRSTSALDALLMKYQKKAGINKIPGDGKAFHGTRRGLGRNLVLAEVPVTNIIQVLGQSHLNSAKPYMMLNTPELKECALDFTNIPLKRGELI